MTTSVVGAVSLAMVAGLAPPPAVAGSVDDVVVHWRTRRAVERGAVVSFDVDELRWTNAEGVERSARWTEIRAVEGLDEAHRPLLDEGIALWRASSRLERGEVALASEIFERLADRFGGEDSNRRRQALEGLVRCRVRMGDPAGAVLAALDRRALDPQEGEDGGEDGGLDRLPDGWPEEAPLWAVDPDGERAAALRVGLRRFAGTPVASDASWIEAAVSAGAEPTAPAASPLATRCAMLRRIDRTPPETLLVEREALLSAAASPAEERWIHARIAAVLAADPDRDRRRRGLIEWLCIPARFPDSVEAPLAFEAAARVAAHLGDEPLADRLGRAAKRASEDLRSRPVSRIRP